MQVFAVQVTRLRSYRVLYGNTLRVTNTKMNIYKYFAFKCVQKSYIPFHNYKYYISLLHWFGKEYNLINKGIT